MADYKQTDRDKVWTLITNMKDTIDIDRQISIDRRPVFIEHAKEFIRWDMSNDFYLEFNTPYTKLRKLTKNKGK